MKKFDILNRNFPMTFEEWSIMRNAPAKEKTDDAPKVVPTGDKPILLPDRTAKDPDKADKS